MKLGLASFLIVLNVLVSCTSPKDEVIDFNELIPKSERYTDDSEPKQAESDTLSRYFDRKLALACGLPFDTLSFIEDALFPDRFKPLKTTKLKLINKEGVVFFGQWTYKDSLKTMNAIFNWMDCFGPRCKSLKYLESVNFQSDALLLFMNDTSLTYISSAQALNEKYWQIYLKEKNGVDLWDLVIVQKKQRKANWYRYDVNESGEDTTFIKLN